MIDFPPGCTIVPMTTFGKILREILSGDEAKILACGNIPREEREHVFSNGGCLIAAEAILRWAAKTRVNPAPKLLVFEYQVWDDCATDDEAELDFHVAAAVDGMALDAGGVFTRDGMAERIAGATEGVDDVWWYAETPENIRKRVALYDEKAVERIAILLERELGVFPETLVEPSVSTGLIDPGGQGNILP